ncbi:MAG: type II toxin-antitoxin system VapC family toxin [Alphaproteobacteria bacterium]|nr:type II toxin-antitoxin system VapC family toxin [Alphaproteobacteria bacterium]
MKYLLDTNILSETRRRRPEARVLDWLRRADAASLHVSVLTLGEIAKGAAVIGRRDPAAGRALAAWLDGLREHYADRVVGIDAAIAETWGRMSAARPLPAIDGLLAASAQVLGMTLVTRNPRDIEGTGVPVFNPWG